MCRYPLLCLCVYRMNGYLTFFLNMKKKNINSDEMDEISYIHSLLEQHLCYWAIVGNVQLAL